MTRPFVRVVDPLSHAVPIVDEHGKPTPQFIRLWNVIRAVMAALEEGTGVVPGTYGSATHVPRITVDQQGRVTEVTEEEIT